MWSTEHLQILKLIGAAESPRNDVIDLEMMFSRAPCAFLIHVLTSGTCALVKLALDLYGEFLPPLAHAAG